MSRKGLDGLEQELGDAVRRRAGRRRRVTGRGVVALAAALAIGGGALAATGALSPSKDPIDELDPIARNAKPDVGAGTAQGTPGVSALRVADPEGGPPWTLRTFRSSRGNACVQVGQIRGTTFGRVATVRGDDTRVALRPLQAIPGANSLCSGQIRGGRPIMRGLQEVVVTGGDGDRRRCPTSGDPHDACPITAVRLIRYGLLGPSARSARQAAVPGHAPRDLAIRPGTGGAYLFVVALDPEPYRGYQAAQRRAVALIERTQRRERRAGRSRREAADIAFRRSIRAMQASTNPFVRDIVIATFAGGKRLQVAGPGRTREPLPGVGRRKQTPVRDVTAPVRGVLVKGGPKRVYRVTFPAPVAITRADTNYTLTMSGPAGKSCRRRAVQRGGPASTRNFRKGESVGFRLDARRMTGGRAAWCPGSYTARIGYTRPGLPFRGRLVGTFSFRVP